jgi:methyl-accepting chemotaxis protein
MSIIRILIAALVAALIVLVAFGCIWLETFNRVTADMPGALDNAIAREGTLTMKAAVKEIQDTRKVLVSQIKGLRRDVRGMEKDLGERAERKIGDGLEKSNSQLNTLNTTIQQQIDKITTPATALFPPIQNTLDRTSYTADLLLDCDHNPDCLANRTITTMKAVEKTSVSVQKMADTVEKATPETAAAVKSTSKNLSVIVDRFAKPTTWIKGVATTAASIIGKFFGF